MPLRINRPAYARSSSRKRPRAPTLMKVEGPPSTQRERPRRTARYSSPPGSSPRSDAQTNRLSLAVQMNSPEYAWGPRCWRFGRRAWDRSGTGMRPGARPGLARGSRVSRPGPLRRSFRRCPNHARRRAVAGRHGVLHRRRGRGDLHRDGRPHGRPHRDRGGTSRRRQGAPSPPPTTRSRSAPSCPNSPSARPSPSLRETSATPRAAFEPDRTTSTLKQPRGAAAPGSRSRCGRQPAATRSVRRRAARPR